ncbi:hypothetical protein Tco_1171393 [Tanacetum coccineum]
MKEVILFYKGLGVHTRQILNSKGTLPSMKAANAKNAIQDMADHSQKWHNGTFTRTRSTDSFDGLAAIQAQLNNLGREIKKVNEKVYAAQVGLDVIVLDMAEDIKVPLILERPFLSTAHAKIDVFQKKIALRVEDDKIVFKSDNPTSNIIKRISRPRVWDLNEPLELRRNQVEDLGLKIEEGEVIDEPMEDIVKTRNDDNEIIVENMDAYRDQDMGEVIMGEPFCREICVKARRFKGMIAIYNGNDSVT